MVYPRTERTLHCEDRGPADQGLRGSISRLRLRPQTSILLPSHVCSAFSHCCLHSRTHAVSSQREEGDEGNHNWWLGLCSEMTLSFLPTANVQASHVAAPDSKRWRGTYRPLVYVCVSVCCGEEGKKLGQTMSILNNERVYCRGPFSSG